MKWRNFKLGNKPKTDSHESIVNCDTFRKKLDSGTEKIGYRQLAGGSGFALQLYSWLMWLAVTGIVVPHRSSLPVKQGNNE